LLTSVTRLDRPVLVFGTSDIVYPHMRKTYLISSSFSLIQKSLSQSWQACEWVRMVYWLNDHMDKKWLEHDPFRHRIHLLGPMFINNHSRKAYQKSA
jgi:hypothetical protein